MDISELPPVNPKTGKRITEQESREATALPPFLIQGFDAQYVQAEFSGANTSGLVPFGPNVLVKMDQASNISAGGIIMVDQRVDRMNEAAVTGIVFEVGDQAFQHLSAPLKPGDRVYIEKYGGVKAIGMDGAMYRLVDERQIACRITEDFKALIEMEKAA